MMRETSGDISLSGDRQGARTMLLRDLSDSTGQPRTLFPINGQLDHQGLGRAPVRSEEARMRMNANANGECRECRGLPGNVG
jgi:hypothetical protein